MNIGLSDLLSGAIGAFVIFVLTVLHSGWVSWQERVRQRTGLLRLVDSEIKRNIATIRLMFEGPPDPNEPTVVFLMTADEWEACRVEVSQLVPIRVFEELRNFYEQVNQLQNVVAPGNVPSEIKEKRGPELARLTVQQGEEARRSIKRYVD
jgi:hypothetical protein